MRTRWLVAVSLACWSLSGQSRTDEPRYTKDGQLMRPENYREWIFLSSGLGMTYGTVEAAGVASPRFDNVFVTPQAYRSFLQTGRWPDKTMFVLEVRASASKGSINKGGHYQEEVVAIETHVKDEARFPAKWEFFEFGTGPTGKPFGVKSSCQACHAQNGAVDSTFVQFYPTLLPVARAKGTIDGAAGK